VVTTVFILFRGNTGWRLRIALGLVLFIFVLLHILNYTVNLLGLDAMPEVAGLRTAIWWSWLGSLLLGGSLLVALAGLWCFRLIKLQAVPKVAVTYVGGPVVSTPVGPTLLEISRMHNVPHAAVCGGRSRCSACRVRIDKGLELQPPPDLAESVTL
jgi:hypothetical protein